MNIFVPDRLPASAAAPRKILVNVFAGSERTRVEMRLTRDASWSPLTRRAQPPPDFVALREREAARGERPERPLPPADASTHLWVGTLPAVPSSGTHTLEVRATDPYGGVFRGQRILTVDESPAAEAR